MTSALPAASHAGQDVRVSGYPLTTQTKEPNSDVAQFERCIVSGAGSRASNTATWLCLSAITRKQPCKPVPPRQKPDLGGSSPPYAPREAKP